MKIALITNSFSRTGGVGKYVLSYAEALLRSGHLPIIAHNDPAASQTSFPFPSKQFPGFEDYKTPEAELRISEIVNFLISQSPDIVHVQANMNFPLEEKIRKSFPAVKSLHVYDFCPSGTKYHHALNQVCHHATGAMCLPRMLYKRCTDSKRPSTLSMFYQRTLDSNRNDQAYSKIITASDYVKQQAVGSGYTPEKIEVIPYFTAIPKDATQISKTGGGEKILMATGRFVREKGFDKLLEAVSGLKNCPGWKLILDGDGPELSRLKVIARRLHLENRVEFPGWLSPQLHSDLYRKAYLVIVPSLWPEPFGLVGIEAMSYGKPVIAFRVGGIPEWLDDQETGFLIEPHDTKKMAEKIFHLIENPTQTSQMGEKGLEKTAREFNERVHLDRLLSLYGYIITQFRKRKVYA